LLSVYVSGPAGSIPVLEAQPPNAAHSATIPRTPLDGEDLRPLPLSMRKTNLARLLARRSDGIFVAPFEQGEIGPDLFRAACNVGA
jgi:hypothetical protein